MLQVCLHANFFITLIFLRGIAWSINCSLLKNGRWECEIEIKTKIKMQVCARIVTKVGISSSMLLNVDICKASRQAGLSDFWTFRIITLKKKKNGNEGQLRINCHDRITGITSVHFAIKKKMKRTGEKRWIEVGETDLCTNPSQTQRFFGLIRLSDFDLRRKNFSEEQEQNLLLHEIDGDLSGNTIKGS